MTQPDPGPADRLPRHTTPTWEVELLISGVAVFAMLQLPGWLNDKLLFLLPRFDESWRTLLQVVFFYGMTAAVILAATFTLHLLLRANWIALVGVHSVYPDGILWDRLRLRPIEREVIERREGDRARAVDRADNRASIVFAMGVVLAGSVLIISLLIVGLFALLMIVFALLHASVPADAVFYASVATVVVPILLLNVVDRRWGARIRKGNWLHRVVSAGFAGYAAVGVNNPGGVIGVLASHHGRRRVMLASIIVMVACVVGAAFGQQAMRSPERFGNYTWFPHFHQAGVNVIDSGHYDDQRDPLHDAMTPFIQSAEVDANYVRLTVPYQPDRDPAAMRRTCPGADSIAGADARADALLRCLAVLHAVSLDGKPLADAHYAAGKDPRTDRPALVAMIDVRALAPGRHELVIARAPAAARTVGNRSRARATWTIPFWR